MAKTAQDIQDKLDIIRGLVLDEQSIRTITETEKTLRRLVVQHSLKDNDAAIAIVAAINKKIEDITFLLQTDENMNAEDRKILFRERRLHQFYKARLSGDEAEQTFDFLDQTLAEKITLLQQP